VCLLSVVCVRQEAVSGVYCKFANNGRCVAKADVLHRIKHLRKMHIYCETISGEYLRIAYLYIRQWRWEMTRK
jgi:hypothetical protein